MGVTNRQAGTRVDEVAEGIFRISTPFPELPGGFSFNQYLLKDDQPLLFHTGPRRTAALVREAVASLMKVEDLRFIGFSHYESDECGALAELLRIAPGAVPVCGQINITFEARIGSSFDKRPPWGFFWLRRTCL